MLKHLMILIFNAVLGQRVVLANERVWLRQAQLVLAARIQEQRCLQVLAQRCNASFSSRLMLRLSFRVS